MFMHLRIIHHNIFVDLTNTHNMLSDGNGVGVLYPMLRAPRRAEQVAPPVTLLSGHPKGEIGA
jgi:hypothetical protein